ncbi:hypothetical protein [Rathayibacter sp. AY1B5]|uniref:hypothetical protein n=1 Tax=Rathayibacter sp. AY1B5 TaxID=2080530 RepID=UPI0011B090A5|nr:hypothetical protein [Rathayibacter sp. AY1B5]
MKKKLNALITAVAVSGLLIVGAPAQAAQPGALEPISPENSYLATPEDLEVLGLGQEVVDAQRAAWEALPETEREAQSELEAEQDASAIDLASVPVFHTGTQNGGVSARTVYPNPCTDQPNGYKIGRERSGSTSFTYTCYIGSGVYDYGANELTKVRNLRPGNYKGRVLYHYSNSNYYWSVDRGPDFNTYSFDLTPGSVYVKSVQLY